MPTHFTQKDENMLKKTQVGTSKITGEAIYLYEVAGKTYYADINGNRIPISKIQLKDK